MEYDKLLARARKKLPDSSVERSRFEIPKVRGHIQGHRTVISNFLQIATTLGRDHNHLLKYVLKELATPGELKASGSVIFGSKVPAIRINDKIKQYANTFVICPECHKPDTKVEKEGSIVFMKCTACGAKHYIKSKI